MFGHQCKTETLGCMENPWTGMNILRFRSDSLNIQWKNRTPQLIMKFERCRVLFSSQSAPVSFQLALVQNVNPRWRFKMQLFHREYLKAKSFVICTVIFHWLMFRNNFYNKMLEDSNNWPCEDFENFYYFKVQKFMVITTCSICLSDCFHHKAPWVMNMHRWIMPKLL
jgi:hypothetical protein